MSDEQKEGVIGSFLGSSYPNYDRAAEIIRFTTCGMCGITIPQLLALIVKKHTHADDFEEHFCGESCANNYYLDRLRENGL